MKILQSRIPFSYKTIKVTQSRINKGLLAIPVSLTELFPKWRTKIYVVSGIAGKVNAKNFTPYISKSRECRIGGMRGFYEKFQIKDGDEIVIQVLDSNTYRIIPEKQFESIVKRLENEFDSSKEEGEASLKLREVSKVTGFDFKDVAFNEYYRLSAMQVEKRKYGIERLARRKERVPVAIKKLLNDVYEGRCQITGFTFTMKNGKPYFEVHHIKPNLGNHVKNLLVVSPNVHAQFTYAPVQEFFDREGWLRRIRFNKEEFVVNHIIDKIPKKFEKEVHFDS